MTRVYHPAIRCMARHVLCDWPQLLEQLGIVAHTATTAAQRGAGT